MGPRRRGEAESQDGAESPRSGVAGVLELQLQAFNDLVARQLSVLAARPAPPLRPAAQPSAARAETVQPAPQALSPAAPAPATSQTSTRAGFWERQGIKPALAPVPPVAAAAGAARSAAPPARPADRPLHFSLYFFGHYE